MISPVQSPVGNYLGQSENATKSAPGAADAPPARKVNIREFSLLVTPKVAQGTALEGGTIEAAANYFLALTQHPDFAAFAEKILGHGIPQLATIQAHITKALDNLNNNAATFLHELRVSDDKVTYMPCGWKSAKAGHAVMLKLVKDEQSSDAQVTVLNRSNDYNLHDVVTDNPSKRALESCTFVVDLASDMGKMLIEELKTLYKPVKPPHNQMLPTEVDLYGRLLIYAKKVHIPTQKGPIAKLQFTPNCPQVAVLAIVKDQLQDELTYRQLMLVVRAFALQLEFACYNQAANYQILFQEAVYRVRLAAAKLGPDLCTLEPIDELVRQVETTLEQDKKHNFCSLPMAISGYNKQHTPPKIAFGHYVAVSYAVDNFLYQPICVPKSCKELIEQLRRYVKKQESTLYHAMQLCMLLRSVPDTSHNAFWDRCAPHEAEKLIELTWIVACEAIEARPKEKPARQLVAEIALIGFDIAVTCAHKLTYLKFDAHFTMQLNLLISHNSIFYDPVAIRTLERIKANFERRSIGRQALFGLQIDPENGPETTYLFCHVLSNECVTSYLRLTQNSTKQTIARDYLIHDRAILFPGFPCEEFTERLKQLKGLSNIFVAAAESTPKREYSAYEGNTHFLTGLSPFHRLKGATTAALALPFELVASRIATHQQLIDDRQNLHYARGMHPALVSEKVGVIYRSYLLDANTKCELLDASIDRELCTLEAGRELSAINALDWILRPRHFETVGDLRVRERLDTILFSPEGTLTAVRQYRQQLTSLLIQFKELYEQDTCQPHVVEWASSVVDRFRYHIELEESATQKVNKPLATAQLKKLGSQFTGKLTLAAPTVSPLETRTFLRQQLATCKSREQLAYYYRAIAHSYLGESSYLSDSFIQDLAHAAKTGIQLADARWITILQIAHAACQQRERLSNKVDDLSAIACDLFQVEGPFTWKLDDLAPHKVQGRSKTVTCTLNLATGQFFLDAGLVIDLAQDIAADSRLNYILEAKTTFSVTVGEGGRAKSLDGTYTFLLHKEANKYAVIHAYKRFVFAERECLALFDSSACSFEAERLLGHKDVVVWKAGDTSIVEDRKNSKRIVFSSGTTHWLMHQTDGIYTATGTLIKNSPSGHKGLDSLIARIAPRYSFLYKNDELVQVMLPSLDTSFTTVDGHWIVDQHSDYKLMAAESHDAVGGYNHLIVLQHVRSKQIRILLPILTVTSTTTSIQVQLPVTVEPLTNKPLVVDVVEGRCCTKSIACHLYLALIFRAQHSWPLAMHHLEMSRHLGEDGPLEKSIIQQLAKHPLFTTHAAAFDIHFLLRRDEHAKRFSSGAFEGDEKLDLLFQAADKRYRRQESTFRKGISGIPESMHVPEWLLPLPPKTVEQPTNKGLENIEKCALELHRDINFTMYTPRGDRRQWYDYTKKARETASATQCQVLKPNAQEHLSPKELVKDFEELASYAIKGTPLQKARVRSYILCYLSQNSTDTYSSGDRYLLAMLLVVLNQPAAFTSPVLEEVYTVIKSETFSTPKTCCLLTPPNTCSLPAIAPLEPLLAPRTSSWIEPEAAFASWPLEKLYNEHYVEQPQFPYKDAACPFALWTSDDPIEQSMLNGLKAGFKKLQQKEYTHHIEKKLLTNKTLIEQKIRLEEALTTQKAAILALLNCAPASRKKQLAALQAVEQPIPLDLSHVIEAMLTRNNGVLLKRNPTLTDADLAAIYKEMITYTSLLLEKNQVVEAIQSDDKGPILARKRLYNPAKHPEILFYAAASGCDPTPRQVEVLTALFTLFTDAIEQNAIEHQLLEFASGGGKTSVLLPILAMFFCE